MRKMSFVGVVFGIFLVILFTAGEVFALTDPVAYWSFDSSNANDDSGNSHNGTIYGKPVFVEGVKGKGLRLNSLSGSGDYVMVPWSEDFRLDEFTLSAWVQMDGDCREGDSVFAIPSWSASNNAWHLVYRCEADKRLFHGYYYSGQNIVSPSADIRWYWHHIVMTKSGTEGSLYLDGQLVASNAGLQPQLQYGAPRSVLIGADDDSGNNGLGDTHWFKGAIDEVRLYNIALSPDQIQELYSMKNQYECAMGDTDPPTGAVHVHDNLIWPANNKQVEVTINGYVVDSLSKLRDGNGIGISSAYLLVNGTEIMLREEDGSGILDKDGAFTVTTKVLAEKGAIYPVELYAADTKSAEDGGPNFGLVDSTYIRVPHDMGK